MAIILANDGMDPEAIAKLEAIGHTVDSQKYVGEDLLQRLKEVDCIVVRSATKIRSAEIQAAASGKKLKLIIRAGVGIDNINVEEAEALGIQVRNTPQASTNAVAELVLGHMLTVARHLHQANRTMPEGAWLKKAYTGTEIMGKTLGLVGLGRIARAVAEKASALGMKVVYTNRTRYEDLERLNAWEYRNFDELLAEADYLSLHVPYTGHAVLDAKAFSKMKEGVFLIDCSRGGVTDTKALLAALESGKVRGAALDVFPVEPLEDEALMNCDKLSLSPHIGAATKEAQARIGSTIVDLVVEAFKE